MTDVSQSSDTEFGTAENSTASGNATGDKLKQQFSAFKSQAGDKARDMAGQGKDRATGALDDAAKFLEDTARTIEEKVGPQYGRYAFSAAESVSGVADSLRNKDVGELVDDARELVRKSPAVAIGAAAALGFILARVLKAGVGFEETPKPNTGSTPGFSGASSKPGLGVNSTTGAGADLVPTPIDPIGNATVPGSTPSYPA